MILGEKYTCWDPTCPRYKLFIVEECKQYHPGKCVRLHERKLLTYEEENDS